MIHRIDFKVTTYYTADLHTADVEGFPAGWARNGEVTSSEVSEALLSYGTEVDSSPVTITGAATIGGKTPLQEAIAEAKNSPGQEKFSCTGCGKPMSALPGSYAHETKRCYDCDKALNPGDYA